MKRTSCEKGWGCFFAAIAILVYGFLYEPLLMIFGGMIILTMVVAYIIEKCTMYHEEIENRKRYAEQAEKNLSYGIAI